jgi:hypothetical protein
MVHSWRAAKPEIVRPISPVPSSANREALRFRTFESTPRDYAITMLSLGGAYVELPMGDRGTNLRLAVECCEQALRYFSPEREPREYVQVESNIANARAQLDVDQFANLQLAAALERRIRPRGHLRLRLFLSYSEAATLVVGEAKPSRTVHRAENAVLLEQVVNDGLLLPVDPAGEQKEEESEGRRQRVHGASLLDGPHRFNGSGIGVRGPSDWAAVLGRMARRRRRFYDLLGSSVGRVFAQDRIADRAEIRSYLPQAVEEAITPAIILISPTSAKAMCRRARRRDRHPASTD